MQYTLLTVGHQSLKNADSSELEGEAQIWRPRQESQQLIITNRSTSPLHSVYKLVSLGDASAQGSIMGAQLLPSTHHSGFCQGKEHFELRIEQRCSIKEKGLVALRESVLT